MGVTLSEGGWRTQVVHDFDNYKSALSEGAALAVVVEAIPGNPHWTRVGTDSPSPLRQSEARLRLACPRLARRVCAPHERGAGGGSDPLFLAAGAPPGRVKGDRQNDTFTLPSERGRSLHSDPCGKAETLKTWSRVVLLNLACPGRGRLAGLGVGN